MNLEKNVRILLDLIAQSSIIEPLFTKWTTNHCPFNAILLFPSKAVRDKYRLRLIESNIYPAIHWELSNAASKDIIELSNRIMTIPVDHRYNKEDINNIAEVLLS